MAELSYLKFELTDILSIKYFPELDQFIILTFQLIGNHVILEQKQDRFKTGFKTTKPDLFKTGFKTAWQDLFKTGFKTTWQDLFEKCFKTTVQDCFFSTKD